MSGDFTHVALIRGINVGGNNKVPMAPLRERLDAAGVGPVQTYIQSGNVVLSAPGMSEAAVAEVVATALRDGFGVETPVMVVTIDVLAGAVAGAPDGFGADKAVYLDDVVFLAPDLPAAEAAATVRAREGVDQMWQGDAVLYFRRDAAQAGKSYFSKVVSSPIYGSITIRNWRTTTALLALAGGDAAQAG